jgi:3-methyladenine DNA glycosylase/8-oxoguanine DNA glycosylase/alkylated DNA nucleotide flippase Atl1
MGKKEDTRVDRILMRIKQIPRGSVATYGDIDLRAPRLVGRVLSMIDVGIPWQRVVRADGSLPIGDRQRDLLLKERVPMKGNRVDLVVARIGFDESPIAAAPRRSTKTRVPRQSRASNERRQQARRISLTAAIDEVKKRDPALAHLVEVVGPIAHRPRNPDGHFGALVRAIVYQQLAGAAARAIHARVRATVHGDLTPKALLDVPDATLRAAGLSAAKLASLRDLSTKVFDGTVVLDGTAKLSDDEIVTRLTTVRGIGRWTAEMYLMFELRRLDVWPVDDLGVRQGYGLAWGLREAPSAKKLEPLGERFRPYRSIAARYCWEAVALFRRGTDPSLR